MRLLKKVLLLIVLFLTNSCASQTEKRLLDGSLETKVEETLNYYLYFPPGYDADQKQQYPLLLFLHGGGEVLEDLDPSERIAPPSLILKGREFPFLILAPQNSFAKRWWNTRAVKQLLDSVLADHRIDKQRIYLTGISRGGGAAWEMAVQYPDTFAAMAVVCGMAPSPYASWINKEMPMWVFHGEDDKVIPVEESESIVKELKNLGYKVRFTKYEGVGHDAWTKAYKTDELYDWFMEQRQGY